MWVIVLFETKDSIVSRKARDYATSALRDGYWCGA